MLNRIDLERETGAAQKMISYTTIERRIRMQLVISYYYGDKAMLGDMNSVASRSMFRSLEPHS
jgi:hypothetical protein